MLKKRLPEISTSEESVMFRIGLVLVVVCVPFLASGQASVPAPGDEVLVVIPFEDAVRAQQVTAGVVRFYHRLPEGLLAGVDRRDVASLERCGIACEVVDEDPWRAGYAVVGAGRDARLERMHAGTGTTVLRSWVDHQLVRGSAADFALLRGRGLTVAEIDREGVTAPPVRTVVPASIQADSAIAAIIGLVSDTTIRDYIQAMQDFGTRYWNNANRDSVARWVRARFLEAGLLDARTDSFQYSGTWQQNVMATIPGGGELEAEIIVGGHHDSFSSNQLQAPGADDNATGAAAALEMARVLKLVNYSPTLTLRFMTYAAEEAGLRGSASYAQRARIAGDDIKAMLNYDMIGTRNASQPDRDVYVVWYTGAEAFRDLHGAMMRMYTTLTPVNTTSYRSGSDSYSFWQQNYPAVFCIERDFSPNYHTPNDLIQYLDLIYARDVVRSGLAMVLTLDKMPPAVPGLSVRDRGDGSSLLAEWDSVAVPDFSRYRVYLGTSSGIYTSNSQQTGRSKVFSGLTTGTPYYVGVSIVDLAGVEGLITEGSATPLLVPGAPAGMHLEQSGDTLRLAWRPNQEVDLAGYHVYQSVQLPTFTRLTATPMPETTMVVPLQNAWYYVTAVDLENRESDSSAVVYAALTGVEQPGTGIPVVCALEQNYPNPFNPSTSFQLTVVDRQLSIVKVYDLLGREVATLLNEVLDPGTHTVTLDASGLASGVYYYRLTSGGFTDVKKMMLMR